jgi:hypothetical protein
MKSYGLIRIDLNVYEEDIDFKVQEAIANVLPYCAQYVEEHHLDYIKKHCKNTTQQCLEIAKITHWNDYIESFYKAHIVGEFQFDLYIKITKCSDKYLA